MSTPENVTALRPVKRGDLDVVVRCLVHPDGRGPFQWGGWTDAGRWHREWESNGLLTPDGGKLMITLGAERLGTVSWRRIRVTDQSSYWSIGIALLPEYRGRGYGTDAQRQLTRDLFAHGPVERIEAETETDNVAERRALERIGFVHEGTLRSHYFRDGAWRDTAVYALLRSDPRP
jgi:RimJ/RimL family protein N-acetyltransferase